MRLVCAVVLVASVALPTGCAVAPASDARSDARSDAATSVVVAARVVPDASECADCHVDIAREWAGSAHHAAFTNDVFQNEWLLHRDPWCVGCHAPRTDATAPAGATAAEGISCAVCHVRGGEVYGAHANDRAPHPVRIDPKLATVDACSHCHEVDFPPASHLQGVPVADGQRLQRTVTEWRAAHQAAEDPADSRGDPDACQSCHMPIVDGARPHFSHAFPGGRDPSLLRRALAVDGDAHCDGGTTVVHLALRVAGAGHDVPTGDVFRRLAIRAELDGRPATSREVVLRRRFSAGRDGQLRESSDDRVPNGGVRDVELVLPACGRAVHWSVAWQALDAVVADQRWLRDEDTTREMASGVVRVALPSAPP